MRARVLTISALTVGILAGAPVPAQLGIPQTVVLPDEDFFYTWGDQPSVDEQNRPDFTVRGVEQAFQCKLTGTFRSGSRMRDFYNLREFEQSLGATLYFAQEAVARLNEFDLSNQLDWAYLDCIIPEGSAEDDEIQERIDKALEKAERQRERRRARAEED